MLHVEISRRIKLCENDIHEFYYFRFTSAWRIQKKFEKKFFEIFQKSWVMAFYSQQLPLSEENNHFWKGVAGERVVLIQYLKFNFLLSGLNYNSLLNSANFQILIKFSTNWFIPELSHTKTYGYSAVMQVRRKEVETGRHNNSISVNKSSPETQLSWARILAFFDHNGLQYRYWIDHIMKWLFRPPSFA